MYSFKMASILVERDLKTCLHTAHTVSFLMLSHTFSRVAFRVVKLWWVTS